jgi:hypothetical protein
MKSKRDWSNRDSVKLHRILKENPCLSIGELCILLNRSSATVQSRLFKLGYKKGWRRDER